MLGALSKIASSTSIRKTQGGRPASSLEGYSVRLVRGGALDWPSNWAGACNWPAYNGYHRITGSSVVPRPCCSCRSHLRVLHVASAPKWTGEPLNYSPPVLPHSRIWRFLIVLYVNLV